MEHGNQLTIDTVVATFKQLLGDAQTAQKTATADVAAVIDSFEKFVKLPVVDVQGITGSADSLVAEYGIWSNDDGFEDFILVLTRNLVETSGIRRWRFSCEILWEARPITDGLGANQLPWGGQELNKYFEDIRQLPGFEWGMKQGPDPREIIVDLAEI
ncbi:MAG: hypothetical protein ACRDAX_06840 [Propionibacteriaceae bacterium]